MSLLPRPELIEFDAENKDHRFEFFYFLTNGKWRKEAPRFKPDIARGYQSVPQMLLAKIAERSLKNEFEQAQSSGDVNYHPV
jgi:hypothetical protein